MLKPASFFEFLNRRVDPSFQSFYDSAFQDKDFIDWNGHLMPYDYGDAAAEYHAIRNDCALCDVSPMRKIRITGADAGAFLDVLVTSPVSTLAAYRAQYVIFCNTDGSLKDDAIIYKFAAEDYLLLPSDIDHTPYFNSLAESNGLHDVSFDECTDRLAGLALQGPQAANAAIAMGFTDIETLAPFEIQNMSVQGMEILVARMGFTADLGYEFWLAPEYIHGFSDLITQARTTRQLDIPGYGLSALEACRIEGGFVVAGWDFATELDDTPGFDRTPYEVGLGWAVDLNAAKFVGKAALAANKGQSKYLLRRLSTPSNGSFEALEGLDIFAIFHGETRLIGSVNCATWSWGLTRTIGNASITRAYRNISEAWVELEGEHVAVQLQKAAFVNFDRRNQTPAPTATDKSE